MIITLLHPTVENFGMIPHWLANIPFVKHFYIGGRYRAE